MFTVSVKAVAAYEPDIRSVWPGSFNIYFNRDYYTNGSVCGDASVPTAVAEETEEVVVPEPTIEDICQAGSLIQPDFELQEPLEYQIGDPDPIKFTLPEVEDSGSYENGDTSGVTSCGKRKYSIRGTITYATITGYLEVEIFTVNPYDAGQKALQIEVGLEDYTLDPILIEIPVLITACEVTGLIEPN